MKPGHLLGTRTVATGITLGSIVLISALLTGMICWTLFDPRWIVFLAGVLFAATLGAVSRLSTAQWTIARRTQQVVSLRAKLGGEAQRARAATDAFRACEERLRLLCDALPSAVLFIDREARCHLHNTAAAMEARRTRDTMDGRLLGEILGDDTFAAMQPFMAESLRGRETSYALPWAGRPDAQSFAAHHVPYPKGDPNPTGVFVILHREAGALTGTTPPRAPAEADAGDEDAAFVHAMTSEATAWSEPKAKLVLALKENQFLLLAQPIAALRADSRQPACCEILLRLKEEEDNLLPPGGFFPIAERHGMMEQLDRWVVRELITLRHDAPPSLYCVNLSAAAVRSHAFARYVQKQLLDRSFDGRRLCFEVAENDLIQWREDVARLMWMLKPFGCRFTVDAFGSAKGSFAALKGLDFDFIKIDGVLIQNMLRNPAELARVRAIATVCRKTGVRTIAEFVEDATTRDTLRGLGIDYVQGFGVARPAPLEACEPAMPVAADAPA